MSYYCENCKHFKNLIERTTVNDYGQVVHRVVGINCCLFLSVIDPEIENCECKKCYMDVENRVLAKDQSRLGDEYND